MAISIPVTLTRKVNQKTEEKTFGLNKREFALYTALKEAKGEVVQVPKLMKDLGMSLTYLRVTKKSLERVIDGWAEISSVYGNGYCLRSKNICN